MNTHNESQQEKKGEDLSKSILERIGAEQVTPRPRWQFLFKDSVFWGAWILSIAIGAGAVAAILFSVRNAGWEYYEATHDNLFTFIVSAMPYLWMIILSVFLGIGYYNMRHTKRGYRYSLSGILFLSVAGSVVLGAVLHTLGAGALLDEELGREIPSMHHSLMVRQRELWVRPEHGLLAGVIGEVSDEDGVFELQVFDGSVRRITTVDLRGPDLAQLVTGNQVRVVGVPSDAADEVFHACFVFPWGPPGVSLNEMLQTDTYALRDEFVEHFGEKDSDAARSTICREVRPYHALQKLQNSWIPAGVE